MAQGGHDGVGSGTEMISELVSEVPFMYACLPAGGQEVPEDSANTGMSSPCTCLACLTSNHPGLFTISSTSLPLAPDPAMPVSIALEMTKALPEWLGQSVDLENVSKQTQTKT